MIRKAVVIPHDPASGFTRELTAQPVHPRIHDSIVAGLAPGQAR